MIPNLCWGFSHSLCLFTLLPDLGNLPEVLNNANVPEFAFLWKNSTSFHPSLMLIFNKRLNADQHPTEQYFIQ